MRLLIGTKKGAYTLTAGPGRRSWTLDAPILFGNVAYHYIQDPRDPKRQLIAGTAGHLGPTLYRSINGGKKFKEVSAPPAFPKAAEGETGRAVNHTFWLTPGHASQPGVWYDEPLKGCMRSKREPPP